MKVLRTLPLLAALSAPLVGAGCTNLTHTSIKVALPNVSLHDVDLNGELDEAEVEKYIRIEIAKGHTGPLSKEELYGLERVVDRLNSAYEQSSSWSAGVYKTRANFLKAYDKYRDLVFGTSSSSQTEALSK